MFVCVCKGLREDDLRPCAEAGVLSPETLIQALGLDDEKCCGRCLQRIDCLLAMVKGGPSQESYSTSGKIA